MKGRSRSYIRRVVALLTLLVVAFVFTSELPSDARRKSSGRSAGKSSSRAASKNKSSHGKSKGRHHHKAHAKHHHTKHHHHHHVARKPRYAYPVEMFMMKAPDFDASPLPPDEADEVARAFYRGTADKYPARTLVRAGVVKHHPLRGGIFWRREPVKYIIMHSTETGVPVSGVRVIESWSSMGRRHPGAQYVVDRDGTIYQSVDPDLATVHINILKTLPGINNDNSIGIEMNHTGSQNYPEALMQSVIRLVTYLQDRYQIESENIITHRYAQQGDHTDPVNFDWKAFLWSKDRHRNEALAYKMSTMEKQSSQWADYTPKEATIKPGDEPLKLTPPPPPTVSNPVKEVRGVPLVPAPTDDLSRSPSPGAYVEKPVIEKPRTEVAPVDHLRLPPLRGPIEVGPEHASDVYAPPYPAP